MMMGRSPSPGFRVVLARPGFRGLWAARTISQAGDVLQFTAIALLVLRLTGSGSLLAGGALADARGIRSVYLLGGLLMLVAATAGTLLAAGSHPRKR